LPCLGDVGKGQLAGRAEPVDGQRRAGDRPAAQRRDVQQVAAVGQADEVAFELLDEAQWV